MFFSFYVLMFFFLSLSFLALYVFLSLPVNAGLSLITAEWGELGPHPVFGVGGWLGGGGMEALGGGVGCDETSEPPAPSQPL